MHQPSHTSNIWNYGGEEDKLGIIRRRHKVSRIVAGGYPSICFLVFYFPVELSPPTNSWQFAISCISLHILSILLSLSMSSPFYSSPSMSSPKYSSPSLILFFCILSGFTLFLFPCWVQWKDIYSVAINRCSYFASLPAPLIFSLGSLQCDCC